MKSFDIILKVIIILILLIFLYLHYQSAGLQRYHFFTPEATNDMPVVFDSKTGEIYILYGNVKREATHWEKFSPFHEVERIPLRRSKEDKARMAAPLIPAPPPP